MRFASSVIALAALAAMFAASAAQAQEVERMAGNPASPLVPAVTVPPGYTTYYISGATAAVVKADAPKGSFESFGDMPTQTRSVLDSLKGTLAKLGLTFGDVVQAHVYMTPDPSQNGGIDFAGMNKVWLTEFGTAAQPNKPARAAVKVAGLAGPGLLVEIEMTAVKKAAAK
jgi:enamine deaminase RidA (YjgF/YER057c/UK114 family)